MFDRYRFSGTEVISEEDIYPYIDSWIHKSSATQRLKAAWSKPELRSRVCEAAVIELEEWASKPSLAVDELGRRTTRLSLIAAINTRFISRFLTLAIGREEALESPVKLRNSAGDYSIENDSYGNFAAINPPALVDIGSILTRGAAYQAADGSRTYEWSPSLIIPFRQSDKAPYWSQVTRVTNGVEHLVLVRSSFRDTVEKLLGATAEPGFTVATPDRLRGLPSDWLLYEKVRVLKILDNVGNDLAPLVPVAASSPIQFTTGLKLDRNIWHRYAPVTAGITAPKQDVRIEAVESSDGSGTPFATSEISPNEATLRLDRKNIPSSGTVFLSAKSGRDTIATARFLSRSANNPRPLPPQGHEQLEYASIGSADQAKRSADGQAVTGYITGMSPEALDQLPRYEAGRFLGRANADETSAESQAAKSAASRVSGQQTRILDLPIEAVMQLTCIERGIHYWKVPEFEPDLSLDAWIDISCKQCNAIVVKRRRERQTRSIVASLPRPAPIPASTDARKQPRPVNYDLLLDALSFHGHGGWSTLETLTAAHLDEPWQLTAMARDLSWLGFIDVELERGKGRTKRWSVTPPSLAFIGPDRAVLSGFRSQKMVKALGQIVEEAGGTVEKVDRPGQPRSVFVNGISPERAEEKLGSIKDPHGRKLRIVEQAAKRLASACLVFNDLLDGMVPVSGGGGKSLSKYDVSTGNWRRVEEMSSQGAFRNQDYGVLYAYRFADGRIMQGPHELVKLLDARANGVALHAYDADTRIFRSRLGCEPPGLLGRALVASSGKLPTITAGQSLFEDISPRVATAVMTILYAGNPSP